MERRVLLSASTLSQPGLVGGNAAAATPQAATQAVWVNSAGGYWDDASNWQDGVVPGPNDDVIINEANNAIITFRTGSATVNSITSSEPISLTGGSLTVTGSVQVTGGLSLAGGTLAGAVIQASNSALTATAGTLSGVTLDSNLAVQNGGTLHVTNGLVLNNSTLTVANAGTLTQVSFDGTQSVTGSGTLSLAGTLSENQLTLNSQAGPMTLTLGSGITLQGWGTTANGSNPTTIINQGTISAIAGGTVPLSLDPGTLINQGTILAPAGTLTLGNLQNQPGASVSASTLLTLSGSLSNAGTINLNGAYLKLAGTFSQADLGTVNRSGGSVLLSGTLTGNLALDATTGSWTLDYGTIRNGTYTATGGATLSVSGGTLDGVTVDSDLNVLTQNGTTLYILDNLVLNATMSVGGPSQSATMDFGHGLTGGGGNQSLTGNGTVVFSQVSGHGGKILNDIVSNQSGVLQGGTLLIGPGIRIHGQGGSIENAGNGVIDNQASITADVSNGALGLGTTYGTNAGRGTVRNEGTVSAINGATFTIAGAWSNSGTLSATNSTLDLGGTFTLAGMGVINHNNATVNLVGTLDLTSGTLILNASTGSWNLADGEVMNGTVTEADGAALVDHGGSLNNVCLNGDMNVQGSVGILGNFQLNGTIYLGPTNGTTYGFLYLQDRNSAPMSFTGTGAVVFGGNASNMIWFMSYDGNPIGQLTIGSGITIHGNNGTFFCDGPLINRGTINADVSGGTISFSHAGPVTNAGTIEVTAGTLVMNPGLIESPGSTFYVSPSAQFKLTGSLTASNTGPASFQPLGPVVLTGAGTAAAPQLLEVMSQDLGNGAAGFTNNFAYAGLSLSAGDYVRLTDLSNNSGGSGREALYVDSLVIPAGATLDLNGLHLYAKSSQISGKIVGEPISLAGTGPNPSTSAQPLTFKVAINGGVPDGETVTLEDASNNNAVVASGALSSGTATLTAPAGTLSAGTHNLTAVYAGDANFAASESEPYAQTVQAAVTSVVVNGNNPALAGAQRSMVNSIVYTFSQAVTLAATNAFTIAVHAGQTGMVPTLNWAAISPDAGGGSTQWVVTFSGNGVTGGSIADGVYDIALNPSAASVEGNASATVASRPADTFYRLYGDVTGDGRVNNADYNLLLNSFNLKPGDAGYLAALDASGTGSRINNADYNLFLNNFDVRFTGFTATI